MITPSGCDLALQKTDGVHGAWMTLPDGVRCLSIQDSKTQGVYAGYRDGIETTEKLAIVVDGENVKLFLSIDNKPFYFTIQQLELLAKLVDHSL